MTSKSRTVGELYSLREVTRHVTASLSGRMARRIAACVGVWMLGAAAAQAATITAGSCSESAVAAAIASAARGDTVVVPDGSCTWTTGIAINGKGIVLQGASANGVRITNNATYGISVTEDTIFHTEIKQFVVNGSGTFILMRPHASPNDDGKAILIHHLAFVDTRGIRAEANRGVIYLNTVDGSNTLNANLEFVQCKPLSLTNSWRTPSTMGTNDTTGESNLYVEDNTFTKVLQSVMDFDDNCRMVIRRNTFTNSATGSHGADTSSVGGRHFEMYDNTFVFSNYGDCTGTQTMNVPFFYFLRGGTGVIADNVGFQNMSSCAWGNKPALNMTVMNLQRNAGPNACWGAGTSGGARYPAPRQIGRGYVTGTGVDGMGRTNDAFTYVGDSEPLYIWNQNVTPALSDYGSNDCSSPDSTSNYIKAGRDYILGVKPGYAKYQYPHPLRSGSGGGSAGTPAAPTNLRITS